MPETIVEEKLEILPEDSPMFPNYEKPFRDKAPRSAAVIDQNGCTGCEVCIDFCPVDCIEIAPNPVHPGVLNVVEVDLDRCIGCTLCAQHCPWETIDMVPTKNEEMIAAARQRTVRSVMYGWGKEKYAGQIDYFEAIGGETLEA